MIIPAAMQIESAVDGLKTASPHALADQQRELHEALGEKSDDFCAGYQLGIQTARVMIRMSGELISKGANPDKVL